LTELLSHNSINITMMLQFAFWITAIAALATLAFVGLTIAEMWVPTLDKPIALLGATSGATLGAYLFQGHSTIALLVGSAILIGGIFQILQTR
jgi:hypothetical protein